MFRNLMWLFSFVLVLGSVGNAFAVGDPSLVIYYDFEGFGNELFVLDKSGKGNDAAVVGSVSGLAGASYGGSEACQITGEGSYLDLDGANFPREDIPTTAFTLAYWMKPENTGDTQTVFSALANPHSWCHGGYVRNGQYHAHVGDAANKYIINPFEGTVEYDEWHHMALTWELVPDEYGGGAMYIDGELVAEYGNEFVEAASGVEAADNWGGGARIGWDVDNSWQFNGLLDEFCVFKRALLPGEIREVMEGMAPAEVASDPIPDHEETDVPRDVILRWAPGAFVPSNNGHIVYFGEAFSDVNDAMDGVAQDANSYAPSPGLDFGKTYYWRVDEVNGAPDYTVHQGEVWSFTTEPYAYPLENITVTASSAQDGNMGPEKTIDGSGLDALDQHSTLASDMWLSSPGIQPVWIQYEFNKAYKLHEMWVWNSNQMIESFLGLGAKDVTIEISQDGVDWTQLEGTSQFAQAPGNKNYTHNTTVNFGGAMAKHVRISVDSAWGMIPQYGLSEVRFFYIPVCAREPQPAADAITDGVDVTLTWRAGREAISHEVSFSTDRATVADGTALVGTTDTAGFNLSAQDVKLNTTYYWRITEVNEAADPSTHIGDIWSFTTPAYIAVENFDQYDDECRRIFFTWLDGLGHNGSEDCAVVPYDGNLTGSAVGNAKPSFAETALVIAGQSMPLTYDNAIAPYYSEAVSDDFSLPSDWTKGGAEVLSLSFRGVPGDNDPEPLYITVTDSAGQTKKIEHPDPEAALAGDWQEWQIPFSEFNGLNLADIKRIALGLGNPDNAQPGGAGTLYVDEIRVGKPAADSPNANN